MMENNYRYSLCAARLLRRTRRSRSSTRRRRRFTAAAACSRESREYESPLNVYGYSKFLFDQVVRRAWREHTAQVVGLRYFNVYGPREQHKGRMASVAFHFFNQYAASGKVQAVRGHRRLRQRRAAARFRLGRGRGRRSICTSSIIRRRSGIFNVGTGRAQTLQRRRGRDGERLPRACAAQAAATAGRAAGAGRDRIHPVSRRPRGQVPELSPQADIGALRAAGYADAVPDRRAGRRPLRDDARTTGRSRVMDWQTHRGLRRQYAAGAAEAPAGRTTQRRAGQARGQQSGRLGEGSPGAVDDPARRGARRHQARRYADRADQRQHRHRARDGGGDDGLPHDAGDAGASVGRTPPDHARVRRRDRPDAQERRHGDARATSPNACATKARASSSTSSPIRTIRSRTTTAPAPRSGAIPRGRSRISCRHGHHRHHHGRVALSSRNAIRAIQIVGCQPDRRFADSGHSQVAGGLPAEDLRHGARRPLEST